MKANDQKIKLDVLEFLYSYFENSEGRREYIVDGSEILEEFEQHDEDDLIYLIERMDGDKLEITRTAGNPIHEVAITPTGIEKLYKEGFDTFLSGETRYEILKEAYEIDRNNRGQVYIGLSDIADAIENDEHFIPNLLYLEEKGFFEFVGGSGSQIQITEYGRDRYEDYDHNNVQIPASSSPNRRHQITLGPNEPEKAKNLFRDFVEIANDEIVIIDGYAYDDFFDLLENFVPSEVTIKVLTTKQVRDSDFEDRVNEIEPKYQDLSVKVLGNWPFHDRYIFRDQNDGWAWGHSFKDSGKSQHTASQLRPINRQNTLERFEEAWEEAEEIN